MRFGFGDCEIDDDRLELRREAGVVDVQPKPWSLLVHLLHHRDRVVTKQELLDAVWPGQFVAHSSLDRAVSLARRAIGDTSRAPTMLVTVARRGYRFVAPVQVLGRDESHVELDGRYVGRAGLLVRARTLVESALAGRGRILVLSGEAGVGKTRTAELLCDWARGLRAEVAMVRGPDPSTPTYWSWTRILRTLVTAEPRALAGFSSEQRRHLARILPDPTARRAPSSGLEGDVARFRLFEAVQSFLGRLVRNRPLAIFIDDVHAIDAESMALLEFVGQGLADWPLLIVLTGRETGQAVATPQSRTLSRLFALSTVERWTISGLVGEDLAEFARLVAGEPCSTTLLDALTLQTGGNPLLVGESLRSLEARGVLGVERETSEWEALLPRGIGTLIDAKLRVLSEDARSALAVASAIGIEVDPELVVECAPAGCRSHDALSELVDAGLLTGNGSSGRLRFSHALVRDAVYESLAPAGPLRQDLHARIADVLAVPPRSATVELAERARHACEGAPLADPARATALAREVAEREAALHDFGGATAWYERALRAHGLGGRRDSAESCELLLGLGTAQIATLGLEQARETLRRAAATALETSRPDLLARAALAYAHRPNSTGRLDPDVLALLEQASESLPEKERALRIRVLSRLTAEQRYGDRPKALELVNAAILEARALGDPAVLAQALDDGTFVLWSPANPERWIAQNAEAAEMARTAGDELLELSGNKGRVTGYLELGDIVGVNRAIRDCGRAAETLRTTNARWWTEVLTATQDLLAGELPSAERHILASMGLADRVRSPDVALEMQAQLVYLRLEQGRAGEIESAAREQARRFPEQPAWRAAHGRVLVACGRRVEAAEVLESLASQAFADVPRDRVWLGTHALAAEVAYACGDRRVAAMIERLLAPYASLGALLSSVLYYGPVAHHLGLVCATRGSWDAAIAHFEAALEIESRLCAHVFAARTRVALARTLRSRDSGGDRARAVCLINDVLAIADRQGLVEIAAEARALEQDLWKGPMRRVNRRKILPAGQ